MRPVPAVPMPLTLGDLRRACRVRHATPELEERIAEYHDARAAFGVSSARTALWLILRALHRLRPERDLVILPAYTCPTVGRSVVEAGLCGLCVDVSLDTFNIDPAEVEAAMDTRVLAVVAPHMFGVPCHLTALSATCRRHGVWLIEDCAQCVGGKWSGALVGSYGDIGFLSMGRSKNLRGYEGGLLWTKCEDLVDPLREEYESLPEPQSRMSDKLKQAAVTVLSSPWPWAIAKRLPGLKVGAEDEGFDPHPSKLADWQAGLGLISLTRLDEYNERRRALAMEMRDALSDVASLRCQAVPSEAEAIYLRFATRLVDGDAGERDALVARLQQANIDARAFYTRTMGEYKWMVSQRHRCDPASAIRIIETNLVFPLLTEEAIAAASRSLNSISATHLIT